MKKNKRLDYILDLNYIFLETVSAFSNFGNGKILFGIDDNGKIVGVNDPDKMCLDIENKINDAISPKPDYALSINRLNNVITLEVNEGKYKPYLYKGKAYRRSDTASIEVDQVELKRLTLEGNNLYYEGLASNIVNPTFLTLEEKLIEKLHISHITNDTLRTLGFYTKDNKLNVAGTLFADKNEYAGIDIAKFGVTIDEICDRERLVNMSILKQYDQAVVMYKRYYQYEQIKKIDRVMIETIPEKAFREAVANALIHRTWDVMANIRIAMFDNRIEITSPGGLPKDVSEEEYLNGRISSLRNPIIANVFFRLNYIEMFGTGIKRIMEAYDDCQIKPSFSIMDNSIQVTLPIVNISMPVTIEEKKIIDLLSKDIRYSSSEIADKLSWSKNKTVRLLNKLEKDGHIIKYGTGRSTKYYKK